MSSYKVEETEVFYYGSTESGFTSSTGNPVKFEEIQKQYNSKNLYNDPDFPANDYSIGQVGGDQAAKSGAAVKEYTWLRPSQICFSAELDNPKFVIQDEGEAIDQAMSVLDIKQGGLGDCWYLAAVAALSKHTEKFSFVVPADNLTEFDDDKYCGAFRFRFYHLDNCKWIEIVVDDRIPCKLVGYHYEPAFANIRPNHTSKAAQFWTAILEKAFAKFFGSYHKIENGFVSQAVENFTGGFSEVTGFKMKDIEKEYCRKLISLGPTSDLEFFKCVLAFQCTGNLNNPAVLSLLTYGGISAYVNNALDGYTDYVEQINWDRTVKNIAYGFGFDEVKQEGFTDKTKQGKGLCLSHAYPIIDVREVTAKTGGTKYLLLKLRNPHGTHEWLGAFCDSDDASWNNVTQDLREKNSAGGIINEGTFWMELSDIIKYFQCLETCEFSDKMIENSTAVNGVWPASLQDCYITPNKSNLSNFNAYKIEVNPGNTEKTRTKLASDDCVLCVSVVLNNFHCALSPNPSFTYYLIKVTEEDRGKTLEEIYNTHPLVFQEPTGNSGRSINQTKIVKTGTYIIVPALLTAVKFLGGTIFPTIPTEFFGLDIKYTLRVFAENKPKLELLGSVYQ